MERTRVKVYQRPNVLPLSLAAFFNDTGADMLFAFYPMFLVLVVGVTDMRLFGIIETIALLFGLLIRPFTGFLADKRGRRHFIWIGYLFLAGSRALQSIAQLWWHIVPPKIMYEVGRALRNPPREALLAESVSQDERGLAFGILGSMDTLGAVIGPLLGIGAFHMFVGMGIDPAVAIRHVLLIAALPTFISVFIILTKTREVRTFATTRRASDGNPHQSTQRNASGFQHILRYRNLLMFTAISCLFSLWAATENFMMVCGFRVLGIDKTSLAQVWVMVLLYWFINITFAPTALISGKLSDKYGRKMQLVLGLITLSFLT
ncbi:MAG TPA: MFS transporter, partial [Armatimonadetes bacterium]|nr:MFS transporter [Armatimonadota bacterium]